MSQGQDIKEILNLTKGIISVLDRNEDIPLSKLYYKKLATDINIDEVYFSGNYPTIYIKYVDQFDISILNQIREIHRTIWNQGKVAFLYVASESEIRVYNCYHRPINPYDKKQNINDALLTNTLKKDEKALNELIEVFGKVSIESGLFWRKEKYAEKLVNQTRVNHALIQNLRYTRKQLYENYNLPVDIIHDLLLRSLFLLYLEDRGATDEDFYKEFHPSIKSYFDILDNSLEITYELYSKLEMSFNGNLAPISEREKDIVTHQHLKIIKNCFWDEINIDGQEKLFDWKIFDFKYIPIELISEIYEDFILNEEGEEKKSKDGAYYTPHSLVEFILNKALPWGDPRITNNTVDVKILDPTCGSGIFLVESFKRLVDRWECNNPNKKISFDTLTDIVRNNLFGIEYNSEAIKVAAFSIYLAMLDQLEPRTLWKEKQFPFLIFDPNNNDIATNGNNLFMMSSLQEGAFSEIDFDLVVGNPPFKEGGLNQETKDYLDHRQFPQEKVIAFVHRSTEFCPRGQIALVAGAKPILFNSGEKYKNFRKFLFNKCYVQEIFNFASLRKTNQKYGGNLFASAVGPACVLFFRADEPQSLNESILYCTPTTSLKNNLIDGIAIDQTEIKYLSREECANSDTIVWKVAMRGSKRDFDLINRLKTNPTLKEDFKKLNWNYGNGYQISKPCDRIDQEVSNLPTIKTSQIQRYYSEEKKLIETPLSFRRIGNKKSYLAPHVILKKGLKNKKVCASYIDFNCAFRDGLYGISAKRKDKKKLKSLTTYINSKLATYLLFLSNSSFGVEREQIMLKEYLSLPSVFGKLNQESINKLSKIYNEIVFLEKEILKADHKLYQFENIVNEILYEAFDLNDQDKFLIEDMIEYSLDLFLEGDKSNALKKAPQSQLQNYAGILSNNLNDILSYDDNKLFANSYLYQLPSNLPLNLVSIKFQDEKNSSNQPNNDYTRISKLLKEIEEYSYNKFSESIYYRKIIKYMSGNTLYIIKPNEKRFWSNSQALLDADQIILDSLQEV